MRAPREPLFLERQTYRRRRLMDAARVLPIVGTGLFLAPILWMADARTMTGAIYLFGVWLALIVVAGLVSRRLMATAPAPGDEDPG